jgi:hypothetical protein
VAAELVIMLHAVSVQWYLHISVASAMLEIVMATEVTQAKMVRNKCMKVD